MDDDQQFCLRWNNHQSTLISVFDTLLENGTLVDCTLAAEGKFLKAHKVVLCACSPYFAVNITFLYYFFIGSIPSGIQFAGDAPRTDCDQWILILVFCLLCDFSQTVAVIATIRQTSHFHT